VVYVPHSLCNTHLLWNFLHTYVLFLRNHIASFRSPLNLSAILRTAAITLKPVGSVAIIDPCGREYIGILFHISESLEDPSHMLGRLVCFNTLVKFIYNVLPKTWPHVDSIAYLSLCLCFYQIPFARTESFKKIPLYSFPKTWNEEIGDLKFQHNKITFQIALKDHLLTLI
jgi:hypothetical protein